jgi:hypothetical protein
VVSERIGHPTVGITLHIYSHVTPENTMSVSCAAVAGSIMRFHPAGDCGARNRPPITGLIDDIAPTAAPALSPPDWGRFLPGLAGPRSLTT